MKKIVLLLLVFLYCDSVFSQTSNTEIKKDSSYLFKFSDETSLMGKVVLVTDTIVKVETKSLGIIDIERTKILSAEMLGSENMMMGKYWFKNPNATRYLFSPSAIPLERGEGYYQNSYLLLNSVYVGITNNISIGAGLEFISTFTGHPLFFGALKGSAKIVKNFYAGGGVLYSSAPSFSNSEDDRTSFGAVFTTYTYGNLSNNISVNAGFGFEKENGFGERPMFSISGMARITRKTFVISENWIVPATEGSPSRKTYYGLYTYGFRFSGEKISVDLALVNSKDIMEEIVVGFPYVGFAVKF